MGLDSAARVQVSKKEHDQLLGGNVVEFGAGAGPQESGVGSEGSPYGSYIEVSSRIRIAEEEGVRDEEEAVSTRAREGNASNDSNSSSADWVWSSNDVTALETEQEAAECGKRHFFDRIVPHLLIGEAEKLLNLFAPPAYLTPEAPEIYELQFVTEFVAAVPVSDELRDKGNEYIDEFFNAIRALESLHTSLDIWKRAAGLVAEIQHSDIHAYSTCASGGALGEGVDWEGVIATCDAELKFFHFESAERLTGIAGERGVDTVAASDKEDLQEDQLDHKHL